MRVISLFDGIGCGKLALDKAGIPVEVYDAYEIDPNPITVCKHNHPMVNHKGDVFDAKYSRGVQSANWGIALHELGNLQSW